jgi:membrane fusion protein (multidrug efflux system)
MSAARVPVETELAGRTSAFQTSEVRPQVSGIIRERSFTEGALVEAGEVLYEIDDSLYQAAADEAAANLASAQATAEAARALADRYRPLAEVEAVSRQAYVDAEAQARQAEAAVAQNEAQLERARINLRYTSITAPISGRIGRSLFTEGALVTANQAEPLAVIQRMDPMFVDIQQSSADLLSLRRALGSGGMTAAQAEVRLKLEDGSDYDHMGAVEFAEATVNESTGTVTLRASVPNPEGLLLPGMFVRALFSQGAEERAFLAPQVAVTRDAQGQAMVWVIDADDTVQRRVVTAERVVGDSWVVTAGLEDGDRVVVEGTGRLTPGVTVRPVPAGTPQDIGGPPEGGGGGGGGDPVAVNAAGRAPTVNGN